ncbi:MAG TPA: extracellular solute-binding protein [Symbiobacteriaceae bacterium]|nr:extracellular solute-binding protein [Symbiobacteriaceae bacterium]
MRRLLALCLAGALLAGCSGGSKATETPAAKASDKPVELTLYAPTMAIRREALDDAIEAYTNKHPNTKIRVRELPMGQMVTPDGKFNTGTIDSGDLVLVPDAQALALHKEGKLRDLSSVRISQLNDLAAPLFDELGKQDGKRYGLPFNITPSTMMVNQDALEQAGLKMPPVDWTVQEFEQIVTTLKAKGANYQLSLNFLLDPLVRAFGGQMYDTAKQAWAFDTSEAKQGLTFVGRLTKAGILQADQNGGKVTIMIGKGPGAPALTALPGALQVAMPGMTLLPFPKGPGGRSVQASAQVGAVLNTSANPEAATDFLKELVSSPAMQLAMAKGGIRPMMGDTKAMAAWQEAVGDKTAQAIELSLDGAYVGNNNVKMQDAMTGLEPFFSGKATLDEVVPSLIARLQ